ncbi:MAG: DUF1801 domain-containing protein [bacterium]|nr:DUF1801 domain-containing protein [bacterium]
MTVDKYFEEMSEDRRTKAMDVHRLVLELYPDAVVSMKYRMPTYESETGWVAIANQKNYWSVYTCSSDKIQVYIDKNSGTKHGKGCLNFRKKDAIDMESMQSVIRNSMG